MTKYYNTLRKMEYKYEYDIHISTSNLLNQGTEKVQVFVLTVSTYVVHFTVRFFCILVLIS